MHKSFDGLHAIRQEVFERDVRAGIELSSVKRRWRYRATHLANGHRSERQIPANSDHRWLPFESAAEFQEARAEAEEEVLKLRCPAVSRPENALQRRPSGRRARRGAPNPGRRFALPWADLSCPFGADALCNHSLEKEENSAEAQQVCSKHGPRRPPGYDVTETLAWKPAELHVFVAKWHLHLPIYRQQDVFAGSGWVPSRSSLNNLVLRAALVVPEFM